MNAYRRTLERLTRSEDGRLPSSLVWLLVAVPLAAYSFPYLLQRVARGLFGREGADIFIGRWILPELGPIEIPTFLLLVWAGVWSIRLGYASTPAFGAIAARCMKVFGVGLLLVAGEEASWGQWLFAFEPPEAIARINHQGELNLHNIVLQGKSEVLRMAFGLWGLAAIFVAPRMAALSPLRAPLLLAPWFIVMTILPLWELITDFVTLIPKLDGLLRSKLQSEFQELMIAVSAVVYVAFISGRLRRTVPPPLRTPG